MAPATLLHPVVALLLVIAEDTNPVGGSQVETAAVVNWAEEYPLDPEEQLALTLQSYDVEADNPEMFTEVNVVAVAAFVHELAPAKE